LYQLFYRFFFELIILSWIFTQNGFDYVLTYYDDPKAAFPSFAYNWMATTG